MFLAISSSKGLLLEMVMRDGDCEEEFGGSDDTPFAKMPRPGRSAITLHCTRALLPDYDDYSFSALRCPTEPKSPSAEIGWCNSFSNMSLRLTSATQ